MHDLKYNKRDHKIHFMSDASSCMFQNQGEGPSTIKVLRLLTSVMEVEVNST